MQRTEEIFPKGKQLQALSDIVNPAAASGHFGARECTFFWLTRDEQQKVHAARLKGLASAYEKEFLRGKILAQTYITPSFSRLIQQIGGFESNEKLGEKPWVSPPPQPAGGEVSSGDEEFEWEGQDPMETPRHLRPREGTVVLDQAQQRQVSEYLQEG